MARESQPAITTLIHCLQDKAPYLNFYRFCQLIEHYSCPAALLGADQHLREPVRFRPHIGMGFPVSEIKRIDSADPASHALPTIRTTFFGLYGITSPLPSHYIDTISQQREGSEVLAEFLDIFNHRLMTQFYRIWRKYSYPATFQAGGTDDISHYLLGLIGLGIPGSSEHIGTPASRFLALLSILRLPTRTIEGIHAIVALLAPATQANVVPHDLRHIPLSTPLQLSSQQTVGLMDKPVIGHYALDINSQILLILTTDNLTEAVNWLPGQPLYQDLFALLQVYLGARLHVRLQLHIRRDCLPDAQLSQQHAIQRLGHTTVLRYAKKNSPYYQQKIIIPLGRYQALTDKTTAPEADENGNYFW